MTVNNNNNTATQLAGSLLNTLSPNQQILVKTLLANPAGLLSSDLTLAIAVSNKGGLITNKLKAYLASENLELFCIRKSRQWLWGIRCKSIPLKSETSMEVVE